MCRSYTYTVSTNKVKTVYIIRGKILPHMRYLPGIIDTREFNDTVYKLPLGKIKHVCILLTRKYFFFNPKGTHIYRLRLCPGLFRKKPVTVQWQIWLYTITKIVWHALLQLFCIYIVGYIYNFWWYYFVITF